MLFSMTEKVLNQYFSANKKYLLLCLLSIRQREDTAMH